MLLNQSKNSKQTNTTNNNIKNRSLFKIGNIRETLINNKTQNSNCVSYNCLVDSSLTYSKANQIRIIKQPPVFNLIPPPNPLSTLSLNDLFENFHLIKDDDSKEKFLLYFLNFNHNNDDLKDKCNSLRIQLLADSSSSVLAPQPETKYTQNTGLNINNRLLNNNQSSSSIQRFLTTKSNTNFLNSDNNLFKNAKSPSSSSSIETNNRNFTLFNSFLLTFSVLLFLFLIVLAIYLYFTRKSKKNKKSVLSSESTFLSNNSNNMNNTNLLLNHNLCSDLNNLSMNEQYQHLLGLNENAPAYNYLTESPTLIPSSLFYNTLAAKANSKANFEANKNYLIRNLNNENIIFKTPADFSSTSSSSSASKPNPNLNLFNFINTSTNGTSGAQTVLTNKPNLNLLSNTSASGPSSIPLNCNCQHVLNNQPNTLNIYNSFKSNHSFKKNSKNTVEKVKIADSLNRKCSCLTTASTSSSASSNSSGSGSGSASVLIKPTNMDSNGYFSTLLKQENEKQIPITSPHHQSNILPHLHHHLNEICLNPYQKLIFDMNTGTNTLSGLPNYNNLNIIDKNTLNKVALICNNDQQFNTAQLVKIVNLPKFCTNCVHHVQVQHLASPTYADTDQHYVNGFVDNNDFNLVNKKVDDTEQFYELIDGENEDEENLKTSITNNLSSLNRKKYPKTNPNYVKSSTLLSKN